MKNRNMPHSDNWKTPENLYCFLNKIHDFNFDPCPYSEGEPLFDGLSIPWGNSNFINPPYSQKLKEAFIYKALNESLKGKKCVLLIPVSTSTDMFHDVILPNASEISFIKRRVKFIGKNTKGEMVSSKSGMHDSMIVVFNGKASSLRISTIEKSKNGEYKYLLV